MLILALDLARITGWALGVAGHPPQYGKWVLRETHEGYKREAGALLRNIIALTEGNLPSLVVCEGFMDPAAQPNSQAIINQLLVHGAVLGWTGVLGIECRDVSPTTARKQVCFHGRAPELSAVEKIGLSKGQIKARQRLLTKRMVVESVHRLKLMPPGEYDDNIADALVAWRWAEDILADQRGNFALMPS